MNAKFTVGIVALVLALILAAGVAGAPTRSSGTLQLRAKAALKWGGVLECPPGVPADVGCYVFVGDAVVPGLGHFTARYTRTWGSDPCIRTLPKAAIEVAGKGEIALAMTGRECAPFPPARFSFDAEITGGSGRYAGASGSLRVDSHIAERGGPGTGSGEDVWKGTLTVPGLDFELTPPVIQGAVSKTAQAPRNAKRARVRYTVTAQDAVDGPVPVTCTPRSGAFFKLGRTKVTCSATDSNGNTGQARFAITVRHRA